MKKTKGFTLIELILTIAILAMLVGVGALRYDFLTNYQEKIEIESVLRTINEARNASITSGYVHTVKFLKDENMVQVNQESEIVERLNLQKLQVQRLESFKFSTTGAPSIAGTYYFQGHKKEYIITIEVATGKVNLIEKEI
ncbi:type II secretion system protein [Lagierella sp. ICN-221743]